MPFGRSLLDLLFAQSFHVQVTLRAPFRPGDVPQPCSDEHQRRTSVGKVAHHAGPPADLPHDPLQHIVRADLRPVFAREGHIGEGFLDALPHDRGRLRKLHRLQFRDDRLGLGPCCLAIFLGVDRLEHRRHLLDFSLRHDLKHVSVEMDHAALPGGFRVELPQRLHQPQALIADDQLDAF
jgi:hypothetical protein